jgi:cell division septation protein DedD
MKRKTSIVVLTTAIAGCALVGAGSGAALAGAPTLFSPAGVSSDQNTTPMPAPHYQENAAGQTYGSAALAPSPDQEPDLIAVETKDGEGYVLKSDLDAANGSTAAKSFKSPEEALAWQASASAQKDRQIPVYEADGKTVIGEFTIAGHHTQAILESEAKNSP